MSIETSIASIVEGQTGQPYPYRRSSWSSPTGPASPAGRTSPLRSGRAPSGSARTA